MKNILITGAPRSGKTTIITQIIQEIDKTAEGMVTKETRKSGHRVGFQIETLSGVKKVLAKKTHKRSKFMVGKYDVFVKNVNQIVEIMEKDIEANKPQIVVIDEIGKMELFSSKFKNFAKKYLDEKKVVGTIMLRDNRYTKKIKNRTDTKLFHLTIENRDEVRSNIMEILQNA